MMAPRLTVWACALLACPVAPWTLHAASGRRGSPPPIAALSPLTAPPTAPPTAPLLNASARAALERDGFVVVERFLAPALVAGLRADAAALGAAGKFVRAGVGSPDGHSGKGSKLDVEIRRSRCCWLLPPPPTDVGEVGARRALLATVEALRVELAAALGLALEPFRTEVQYLDYPAGGYYQRHFDVGKRNGGWLSYGRDDAGVKGHYNGLQGSQWRRTLSFLFYLNDDAWCAARDGGALRVFRPPGGGGEGGGGGGGGGGHVDVIPAGGTLVLFRSDSVEHEVLETRRPRYAIAGWFRVARPGRPSVRP